jgi:hypothetical protein
MIVCTRAKKPLRQRKKLVFASLVREFIALRVRHRFFT